MNDKSHPVRLGRYFIAAMVVLNIMVFMVLPYVFPLLSLCLLGVAYLQHHHHLNPKWINVFKWILSFAMLIACAWWLLFVDYVVGFAAFALTALSFKWLEIKSTRDVFVAITFAFFVSASCFVFNQQLWMSVLAMVHLFLLGLSYWQELRWLPAQTQTLLTSNQLKKIMSRSTQQLALEKNITIEGRIATSNDAMDIKGGRLGIVGVLAGATVIMLLLSVMIPRFPPLWQLPKVTQQGVTGVTDQLTFGSVSSLAQSFDRALEVTFEQPKDVPAPNQRYFRGPVLDYFDGQQWLPSKYSWVIPDDQMAAYAQRNRHLKSMAYSVNDLGREQPWVYHLESSIVHEQVNDGNTYYTNLGVMLSTNLSNRVFYLRAYPNTFVFNFKHDRLRYLQLPAQLNPKSKALAAQLNEHSGGDVMVFWQRLQRYITQQSFQYSLTPPLLTSPHKVDEFLFDRKVGFCEHYAVSAAVLLRQAGYPTRLVLGYMGGKVNEKQPTQLNIQQLDAHAWVEYWHPQKGWVRGDLTEQVMPERLLGSMRTLMSDNRLYEDDVASQWLYAKIQWMDRAIRLKERMEYWWQATVVNFDSAKRPSFLRYIQNMTATHWMSFALSMVGVMVLLTLLLFVWMFVMVPRHIRLYINMLIALRYRKHRDLVMHHIHRQGIVNGIESFQGSNTEVSQYWYRLQSLYIRLQCEPNLTWHHRMLIQLQLIRVCIRLLYAR